MSYNYSKLLGRIKEKCDTQAVFAANMGLSEKTISEKLNGKLQFKQKEISDACRVLDIECSEIPSYFFTL